MQPDNTPEEKLEILPESVATSDDPYVYKEEEKPDLPPVEEHPEQLGLALLSGITALILPIIATLLWVNVKIDPAASGEAVQSYAIGAIVLFIILIFVTPITSIFSIITGVLAYKRSRTIGRYVAIGSFVITAVGIVLVMLFVNHIQQPPALT